MGVDGRRSDQEIGTRIRRARVAKGWTHEELAARVGVNWRTVHRWQNGQLPKLDMLHRLAGVLGVPAAYLLGTDDVPATVADLERQLHELAERVERLTEIVERLDDREAAP